MDSMNTSLFFIRINSLPFWMPMEKRRSFRRKKLCIRHTKSTVSAKVNLIPWIWMKNRETGKLLFWSLRSKRLRKQIFSQGKTRNWNASTGRWTMRNWLWILYSLYIILQDMMQKKAQERRSGKHSGSFPMWHSMIRNSHRWKRRWLQ